MYDQSIHRQIQNKVYVIEIVLHLKNFTPLKKKTNRRNYPEGFYYYKERSKIMSRIKKKDGSEEHVVTAT